MAGVKEGREKTAAAKIWRRSNQFIARVSTMEDDVITQSSSSSKETSTFANSYCDPIAISIHANGMDKLIHIEAVIPAPERTLNSNSSKNIDDSDLLRALSALSSPQIAPDFDAGITPCASSHSPSPHSHFHLLRSQRPRTLQSGSRVHLVAFSKHARVQAPSRKNLVVTFVNGGTRDTGDIFTEESTHIGNPTRPPALQVCIEFLKTFFLMVPIYFLFYSHLLFLTNFPLSLFNPSFSQLGKLTDDEFALDFWGISPLQAFAIAVGAFDT